MNADLRLIMLESGPPVPTDVIRFGQATEILTNFGPVSFGPFTCQTPCHEGINLGCAVKNSFYVGADGLIILEPAVQPLSRILIVLQEPVDVVLAVRAVQATAVKRRVETLAKLASVFLELRQQSFDFLVVEPVRRILRLRHDGETCY